MSASAWDKSYTAAVDASRPPDSDATEEHVDLTMLVRKAVAQLPDEPAPARIAEAVLARIPVGQERALLATLLPRFVGDALRRLEQATATDPRAAWEDLLTDRVPTKDGYRFLRDCSSDDIRAGAQRRRMHAEGLTRRAVLYEAIAERLDAGPLRDDLGAAQAHPASPAESEPVSRPSGAVPTPSHASAPPNSETPQEISALKISRGMPPRDPQIARDEAPAARHPRDLHLREGVEIVVRSRGYVPPTGRRLAELAPHMRPTINEILDEIAMIPADILTPQLLAESDLFEKVALAEARGWGSTDLTTLLESDQLIEAFYEALGRVKANLDMAIATQRAAGDDRTRRRFGKDAQIVQERQRAVRRLLHDRRKSGPSARSRLGGDDRTHRERALIEAHSEEYATELRRYLTAEGLTFDPPHRTPPQSEAWQYALDHGWVKNSPEACNLLALDDHAFEREVGIDITGNTLSALREPGILLRWQATLKVLSEKHSARGVPSDPLARARASRFHAALMQRQAEAKRLSKDVHLQVISLVDRHNDKPVRQRLQRMARATILARYADELDKHAPGAMPPNRS